MKNIVFAILLVISVIEIWRLVKYKTLKPPISKILPLNVYSYYFYFIILVFIVMFITLRLVINNFLL